MKIERLLSTLFLIIGSIFVGIGSGNWWYSAASFCLGAILLERK